VSYFSNDDDQPVTLGILIDDSDSQHDLVNEHRRTVFELVHRVLRLPRPGILMDSALGTFDVENVLKERMHVQPEEARCRGVRRSP